MKKIVFTILVLFLTGCTTQEYTIRSYTIDYSLLTARGCDVILNEPNKEYTIVKEIFIKAYPGEVFKKKENTQTVYATSPYINLGWKDIDYNDVLSAVFNEVKKIDCDGIMNMRYTPLRNSDGKEIGMLFSCYAFKYIK